MMSYYAMFAVVYLGSTEFKLGNKNKEINQLCLTKVTLDSLITDKPLALGFQIKLKFGNVGFCGGRKTGEPGEKPSEQGREPTTNSTHI